MEGYLLDAFSRSIDSWSVRPTLFHAAVWSSAADFTWIGDLYSTRLVTAILVPAAAPRRIDSIIVFMLIVHGTSLLPSIYRWADVTVNVFGELPVMSVMLINVSHKRMRIMLHFTAGRKSHGRHARSGHPMSFSGSGHLKEAPRGRMEP